MYSSDPYLYPETDTLINLFDCRDSDRLKELETLSTAANLVWLQMHPIEGRFDFDHLKEIHRFIFQDVYKWAGQIRTVDIGKGNLFCRTKFINEYASSVFSDFFSSCSRVKANKRAYVEALASHYADLNALHPFREGNGRAQREFIRELCLKCGYVLDLTRTKHQEMLNASVESFNHGNYKGFVEIFTRCVIPMTEYMDLQNRLTSDLLILSSDD